MDHRSGRAEAGSRRWAGARDAGANDSLPSCHHNIHGEGAGCAHGRHPGSHHGGGCNRAGAGRAGHNHPAGEGDSAELASANGPGRSGEAPTAGLSVNT